MANPTFLETLNQAFPAALVGCIGAVASAFFGAWTAQRIARREKTSDSQLAELRSVNAAVMASFVICNAALVLKRQHLKPLYVQFQKDKAKYVALQKMRESPTFVETEKYVVNANFSTLQPPAMPLSLLTTLVYEKLTPPARVQVVVAALSGSIALFAEAVRKRNELIGVFKTEDVGPVRTLSAETYFGLPKDDKEDREYSDALESIYRMCDEIIFFSDLLCADLTAYGKIVLAASLPDVREEVLNVHEVDFSGAKAEGLMPNPMLFANWTERFSAPSPRPLSVKKPRFLVGLLNRLPMKQAAILARLLKRRR